MLNRNVFGIVAYVVTGIILIMVVGNFAYAKEEEHKHKVPHKHIEAASPSEKATMEYPVCPYCKEVRLTPNTKRGVVSAKKMVCPHCKGEVNELAAHYCDKCGKDVMVCVLCQKASVDLKPAIMEGKCPKCKEVSIRRIKGNLLTPPKTKMKCPDCKKKQEEWLIQHCDTCDIDFMACPLCEKEQEKKKN